MKRSREMESNRNKEFRISTGNMKRTQKGCNRNIFSGKGRIGGQPKGKEISPVDKEEINLKKQAKTEDNVGLFEKSTKTPRIPTKRDSNKKISSNKKKEAEQEADKYKDRMDFQGIAKMLFGYSREIMENLENSLRSEMEKRREETRLKKEAKQIVDEEKEKREEQINSRRDEERKRAEETIREEIKHLKEYIEDSVRKMEEERLDIIEKIIDNATEDRIR